MSNTKPHENLYNALNQQGYDIGDLEQFTEKLKDAQKRHALYDTISTEFNVGDFDNFENTINYLWSNEDVQPISPSEVVPQPLQENIAIAKSNPMDKVNPALRTQSAKPIGDVQASQNIGDKAALTFKDVEPMPEASAVLQRNADATTPQDAIQQAVSQDLIGQAASQEWQRDTEQHYKSEKERLQALYNKELAKTSGRQFSSSFMDYNPSTDTAMSRDASLYSQALQYINDAEHHMSNVRNDAGLAQGFSDAIFDIDTLTLGLDSLSKNATLKAILDKADADQPLTQAEESLLNAALYKQFTEAALPNGRWYNVGRSIGEQVPYMLEFALSGGVAGALTKGASKAIGKQVVKYINNLALKNGSKIANRTARNVFARGSRMLGNTLYQLPGGVMRAAAQTPLRSSVYNDIIERQIGTLGYNPGEKGALDYTGRIDADNTADAITKGLTSGFITNLTESVGGEGIQFITNKIGGLMGKGISAVAKDFRSPRWYNRLRESFRRNGFGEFVKATSWQGPVAEYGEELLDQTLNAIFVGDSSLDPNSENYVFDLDNLIDTAITTGAISLFMGAAGGLASGKIHRDVNKAFAQAKKNIDTLHYTDTEINALNNIATSRPQEASKWVSSITRTMRTLAIRSAEIENSLSPEARTLLSQPYTEAEFNELSPYDQQAVMALAEINSRFNDLTIQRDYVVAGINYNALSKGLKESVAPQAEAAMADIQANALRDSDYTINVRFKGQDGYLVSGTADIDNLPDGRTVATLPAGNIYQVRTKSPDGQWIIQQAVAEDIVPGSVTPTQQLIDETTARIYTPVQNLINAEQAQAQVEVAQSTEQPSTPTGLNAPIGLNDSPTSEQVSDQVSDQVATPPTGLNAPSGSTLSTEAQPLSTEAQPLSTELTTSPSEGRVEGSSPSMSNPQQTEGAVGGIEAPTTSPSVQTGTSTNSTQAKLAHIASWQQAIDVPIVIFHDISEVDNPQAVANIQAGNTTPGWIANDTVYIYLPHAKDERDIDATIMHECIAHFGIPRLFATQEQADAFYDEVWNAMPEAEQYRFLSYPGVSHLKGEKARRVAADEYIAHLAEQIRAKRAGEAEVSLWQRIVSFFRNALRRANVNLRLNDTDLTQLLLQSLDALKKNNEQPQDTTSDNALDANEVAVTLPSNGTETRFSIRSFREEGRAKVTNWLNRRVKSRRITKQEAQDILDQLDTIYDICQEYTTQYAPFGDWSEAQVNVDANGNPVLSVIKSNGEYAMNLDFSLVCKKRRTLDAVFQEMITRDIINDFELDGVQVAKVNEIIRSYGFETACRLCFVDAKRFRIAAVADTFVELYNELSSMSDRKLRQVINEEPTTVRGETAQLLLNDPSQRIKVSRSDFMSAEGFERIKRDYPEIMKLYNAKKGTGGPKASFGDVQYLNEIENRHQWTPNKAYSVGGVRLQSFSDYVPRMVFDYVQMIADLAAKHLPVHAYTKEDIFAKQFGLTGIKINLSLVPRVNPDGIAPGLDRDGNYVWQEGETFPYDTAIAIQNAPGYRDNCGTIAVGVSDAHILKMLDDENIRMVIPYHKSGLNPAVAIFNNIDAFVDYTNEQNTRYSNGTKLSKDEKQFNFNEALRKAKGNPRIAAQQYLDWCRQNNYLPKFDKFASHPNYYKLLEDFTTMYTVDGVDTIVPQHAVEMRFPTEQDAFGSMRNLIAEGLEADAILEGQRNEQLSAIVDEIAATLPTKTQAKTKTKTKTKTNTTDTRFSSKSPEEQDIIDRAKANGTYLLAPNGQPTNLTPRQWAQVRTRAFKEWFGDWESDPQNASKIVDENGEPRVVYHQTNAEEYVNVETGQEWDDLSWQEKMEWDNRDDWDEYWEPQDFYTFSRKSARTTDELDGFFFAPSYDEYHEYGERTIEAFLNIRKPAGLYDYHIDATYDNAGRKERLRLQKEGYDGVITEEDGVIYEFIAFEPNQIKSATDNIGTFDSNNPDIRFRIGDNEQTALLNTKQPKTSQPLVDIAIVATRFRITKRTRETINTWLNKRTDLDDAERNAFWIYIENEEPVKQLAMGKWFANGAIRLPEDQPTVDDAMRMARKMNIDPLQYNAPGLITSEYHERFGAQKETQALLSPDDERFAGILTDKVDYGNGITVYTVQDDAVGQDAVRELMNDHLGRDFNCWCLLYADANGNITQPARSNYWQHYNSVPKRVAFKDGKICSFCASDKGRTEWWDLSDQSHGENIPVETELPGDSYGRRTMFEFNESTNEFSRINNSPIFRGNKKNGLYEEWYNEDTHSLAIRANFKGGKIEGLYEEWFENGQPRVRANYKGGERDGLYEEWFENGQPRVRANYKGGERDGLYEEWFENGQPRVRANYKGGERDGLYEEWYKNGKLSMRADYKNGRKDGSFEEWYKNGQLSRRADYKGGLYEEWYENGQLSIRANYKGGERDGLYEEWYENGQIQEQTTFKYGKRNGTRTLWYLNGQIQEQSNYVNDSLDGFNFSWDTKGNIKEINKFKKDHLLYNYEFINGEIAKRMIRGYVSFRDYYITPEINKTALNISRDDSFLKHLNNKYFNRIYLREVFVDGYRYAVGVYNTNGDLLEAFGNTSYLNDAPSILPEKDIIPTTQTSFRSINPGESLSDYARAVAANGQQTTTPTDINTFVALATANDKNKLPDTPIRFRMTRRTESTVTGWINRRTDLTPDERKAVIDHIDNLDGTTLQLATAKWFAQGTIRIPEDNIQVEQAIKVASRAKVDPLAYDYPQAIISAFPEAAPKQKPINPDDVPTLTNKQELPNGLTVYTVDESRESQQAVRDIINTHLGTRANPWCITSALDGNLTDESWEYWESYSAYPKRIAFHDGKVVALFASDSAWPIWWDTQDRPHYGIPLGANITDGEYNEETNTINTFNEDGEIISSTPADTADDVINTQSGTRFRVVEDADTRERFDREIADGNFVKTYRSMVLIDGELYPPMFSKTEKGNKSNPGQLRQPSHEGDIEQSEEDLSKATLKNGKYYITLIKDNNKETRDVAYNPYLHTASSPLNDQFKEAQDRPNMVTVEMYIPLSELTSGYQAEGAHDTVGWKPWPSGILRKYIDKPRKVLLTQRGMVHRIVPDSEVASLIDNDINGNLHTLPTNVFTPSVRAELEKLGYRFINTNNAGKITDGQFAGLTYSAAVAQNPEYFGYKPNPTPPKGGKSKDSTSFRSIKPGESLTDYARAVVANTPETRFRVFGGNSGYVGYSMSKRAEQAREEGNDSTSTTRFRSIAADNRTADIALDTIEQATADYADSLNAERGAIIDAITPAPGDSLRTIAEKTRLRSIGRMITKDNASMHLFDTLCNDVLANAARKNDKNALNAKRTSLEEKFTDNKVRVNQLLDKIQQGGGYIRPEDNYWYRENAHKASAQALSRLFKAKYESRLFEALAPIIRLLDDNTNIPTHEKGFVPNIKRGIQIAKIGIRSTTERWYETLYQLADYLPFDKLRDRLLKSINDKLDDLNHTDYGRLYLTASYYMQAVTALERQKVKQEGKIAEQQTIIEDAKILADSQLIDVDKRIEEVQRSTELTDEEKAAQIDRLRLEKVRIAQTLEDTITEAKEAMDVINEADYGGLAGVQYAIFDLYGMINENVEAIKGDRQKLTVLAQELEIPTVEEFVKQVEDIIGSSKDANSSASQLWDAVRAISEYELETSYMAGLISRSGYQALTYNTDFDGLLKERYEQQKKAILDHPDSYENINKYDKEGNLKSTRKVLNDNARIALDKLNQEYAEAIDAIPMPGKNGNWQHLIDTGWLTQQEVDNIHRKYEHYLPLKGHAEMTAEDRNEYESHTPKNQSTIREAKGHTQLARDVITQIVQDALGTIQAAERNKALTLLYKTLTNNQDLAVAREQYKIQLTYYTLQRGEDGKMHQVPYGDINENGVYERMVPTAEQLASGEVFTAQGRKQIANIDIPITNDQRDEHSVSVRVNGEDYTMFFYDKRIADAITGRNNNYPEHVILKALSWINKKMAAFITSLSPAFQLGSNMWRDIQEMFSNTIIDQGLLTALKALGNRFNQLIFGKINKAVYRYQIGKLTPETARTDTEKLVVEYFVNGGPVNITQLPDYDTVKLNVRNDLLQYLTTGKMPSDNSWLSRIAERVELASRLSVYIASRNIGKSVNEAIINSKEATVNFDRKGTEASLWGSYIMFFNAIMQGVRRQVQLWRNHPARAIATYGFISFSITPLSWMISHAFQQLICLITGDDDEPMLLDEMMEYYYSFSPEYRQRNFILILGRDDSIRLPLALNYLPFSTIGDSFYRLMFDKNRRDDANDMALDVLSAFLETYTPVGQPLGFAIDAIGADTPKEEKQAVKSAVGSALPPVFQPVAQNVFNYNFMGGQLYNEPFDENDNEPYYLNAKAHTQDIYINISQWLSNASGGDEVYAGDINIHPEEIENFFGLFGFFSEFTEQVLSVISMATDGEDNTLNDYWKSIPVLSRFTAGSPAEYKEKSLQGMFYNDKEELDRFKNMREAYIGTKKYDERVLQQYSPDEQRYFADLATMESISKKIRKEIKAATPEGEAPKYHEDERLKAIYNLANEQYHSLASGDYKPIDNPYYTYMYIKDAIEKAPHRTTDGTYRLIDSSERSADSRTLKQLLQSFSKTRSMYKALPSGYYPGMPLDNREEQALSRFNTAVGELIQAYQNTDLNNLTSTDNAK